MAYLVRLLAVLSVSMLLLGCGGTLPAQAACVPGQSPPGSMGCEPVSTTISNSDYIQIWQPGLFPDSARLIQLLNFPSGGITSVALTLPGSVFTVSGSPVVPPNGTLAAAFATQSANTFFRGPNSGGAATPAFGPLVAADLPLATSGAFGAVKPDNTTISISAGVISTVGAGCTISGTLGQLVYNGGSNNCLSAASASITAGTLSLGASGTLGAVKMGNATSGTLTLQPQAGALGAVTVLVPALSDTLVNLTGTQTLTNKTLTSPALGGTVTGAGTIPNVVLVNSSTTINGTPIALGASGTVTAAAGTLTGTTLASNVVTSSLTSVAVGTIGTAVLAATGTSGHALGFLDGANTISGLWTFTNSDLAMLGSSTGKTTITSLNSSATNYTMNLNAASGNFVYLPTGVTPVNSHIAVWSGTTGALIDGGVASGAITVNDGLSDTVSGVTSLTVLGGVVSGSAPNATFTPQSTNRIVTAGGTAPIVSTDAGNVVIYNNSGLTSALAALSSSYLPAGQSVTICNEFAGTLSGTSVNAIVGYPTGGTAGAYTFTVAAPQNGVMTCIGFLSDGTTLYANFALPPAIAFLTTADQVLTGGFIPTAFSNGTASSGTKTVDCGANPIQTVTNGGAFTLAMATNDGTCTLRITNNGSAGAITFSGFSVGSNTGDALTTTNTSKFDIELTRVGGNPRYYIHALQAGSTTFALVGTPVQWSAAATGTSGAYNTTGSQIIAVGASYNGTSGFVPVLTDSLSNTWVGPTTAYNGAIRSLLWYCVSCSTGAAQTFTLTTSGGNSFFEAGVEAFSAPVSYAIDGALVTNAAGNAPTVNPGSKTPAGAGDLFITVLASSDTAAAITVGNSFTPQPATVASPGSGFLGFGMAYLVNAGSSAQNPTWTITAGTNGASAIQAAFVP